MYIFALFGLFIFSIGGAIPASQALVTNFFTSHGLALSMICQFSCQSLMYRCEWHGLIDILYDCGSPATSFFVLVSLLRLLVLNFLSSPLVSPRVPLLSYL